jgi:hypothetical protein
MGRVILTYNTGKTESLKCKSKERAAEIARKRPSCVSHVFYDKNDKVKVQKKIDTLPQSFEELDRMIKQENRYNGFK